ncbi:WD40-repeat-containing domain protein [Phycomyces blakesleeanus]
MASSVSLPLVVWHGFSNPNTTCLISSYPNVYAGQKDGTILVYTFSKTNPSLLQHALVLIGHKTSVAALCIVKTETDAISDREDVLISASEDGEVARWNTSDGRCLTSNPNGFFGVPSQLKVFRQFSERYIFCCGQSNEICILNTTTLEVVRVWGSHPNWVTCTDFYDPVSRRGRLATLTMNGRLDVWDFDVSRQIVLKDQSAVYQSLLVKDTNDMFDVAFDLISNEKMPSLCMALTSRNVIIFALSGVEFIPHVTLAAKPETSWTGGAFCGPDRCVLWTQNGEFYDYHLKAPEGIRPGIMVDESHLYYSAHLMKAYSFENEGLSLSLGSLNVTLCKGLEEPTAVLFCNRPTASAFCLVPLGDLSETKPSTGKNDIVTRQALLMFGL